MVTMTGENMLLTLILAAGLLMLIIPAQAFWIYAQPSTKLKRFSPRHIPRSSVSRHIGNHIILDGKSSISGDADPRGRPSDEEILEMMRAEHEAFARPYEEFNEELAKSIIEFMSEKRRNADANNDDEEEGQSFNDIIEQIEADHLASIPQNFDPHKLFVANLPFKYNENHLADLMARQLHLPAEGLMKSVKIVRDRETQKSKGYAFVEFREPIYASAALEQFEMLDYELDGRKLVVKRCEKRRRVRGKKTS